MSNLPNFKELRHDKAHHLGLGDIRLTIAQQDAIDAEIERLRAELKTLAEGNVERWERECADAAEIERLRAALEQIEAQIASLRNEGWYATEHTEAAPIAEAMQALLDVAVAAEQHITQGQSNGVTKNEWHSFRILSDALDKLREVGDD